MLSEHFYIMHPLVHVESKHRECGNLMSSPKRVSPYFWPCLITIWLLFSSSLVLRPQWWQPDNSTVVALSSSCPFQVSVCFNYPHDHIASSEVTAKQLGHTAAGVSSACVSDQMINVLFVTVSNYINELFIINAHTDALIDKDRVCVVSVAL